MPFTYSGVPQEDLKAFVSRRHPDYAEKLEHWNFLEATYKGGREWFEENLFSYHKETPERFARRQMRAYRFNHTREVVDLIQKYIFKSPVVRNERDASQEVKAFWLAATRTGLDISQLMGSVSSEASKLGGIWVFTDTTRQAGDGALSITDARNTKAQVYAYTVSVQDVLDLGYDKDGKLAWILVREWVRDDVSPMFSSGDVTPRYRLWTLNAWFLFKEEAQEGTEDLIINQIDEGLNPIGEIPGFRVDHVISEHRYSTAGLIDDIAYLDRAVANYLSNTDAIIQDQTFSQLVMPAQGLEPGSEGYKKLVEIGTSSVFTYDGEAGGKPEYISPDPKQAGVILQVINKIIGEIYHTIGMAGERTKQDNAVGIDNSSGVAKAYDFERVNSLLVAKAGALENAENRLIRLVSLWNSAKEPEAELVKYPETFDVRSLFDEFTIAENLLLVEAPDTVRREQMKQVIDKMFPRLAKDLRARMESELTSWPPKIVVVPGAAASGGNVPKPAAKKRQGQVTKSTG